VSNTALASHKIRIALLVKFNGIVHSFACIGRSVKAVELKEKDKKEKISRLRCIGSVHYFGGRVKIEGRRASSVSDSVILVRSWKTLKA